MARTRLGLWTEGSIVTLILTAFLLLVMLPLVAKSQSSKTPQGLMPKMPSPIFKMPVVNGEEATLPQTLAMEHNATLLQGTIPMKTVGIFFPPIGPTVISTPTKSSQIFGGNDSAAQVPAVVELKIETPPYEVFRSTVDAPMGQVFSIDPSYNKSQVKIHF